jgi:hypothetical protein
VLGYTAAQTNNFATREAQRTFSPQVSPTADSEEQRQIAGQFVQERLAIWQQRLKLADWKISIEMARRDDLKPKTLGATRWDKDKKSATIWVLDPSEYKLAFREVLNDLELTVVHELVHLELASLPRSEASRNNEEHAVNRIAEALIALDIQK